MEPSLVETKSEVAADSLSLSELRYRRLFEAARDGILLVDPDTRTIVDVNPFMIELLGYERHEFIGKELFQLGLAKDEDASRAAFQELLRNGYVRYENLPFETKDGRLVEVELVCNIYPEGLRTIIQCNVRDITVRRRAENALRESEERFKLVTRVVSDAIWDWDLLSGKRWWSPSFTNIFGYPTEGPMSGYDNWECHIHPEDLQRVLDGVSSAVALSETWTEEYRFRRLDGTFASVVDKGYIIRNAALVATRMVGGIQDVTKKKELESSSIRAQRMESIGTLAGGIAHDLNNVLTPVLMSIELLKFDPNNDPERRALLDTIQVSCRRGADLVRQVLSFARGLDGDRVEIHLAQIVEEVRTMIQESFPRNIRLVTKISDKIWPFTGDPTQIHQVLLNLAVNARDAMPSGGTLTISATNIELDPRDVGGSRETKAGRHVLLEVSDTGTGITKDNCDRIFEPFFTTKKIGEGTGFGLSIVHSIVKSHGGYLSVDSVLGQGTKFKVFLPADPGTRSEGSLPPIEPNIPRGSGEHILVVDDEFAMREITRVSLQAFGYRVTTASDGAEAVDTYKANQGDIALVIMDMMMPVMDGPTAISAIRRLNLKVPIIAVSGMGISTETRIAVSSFLSKPYSTQTLLEEINNALRHPIALD